MTNIRKNTEAIEAVFLLKRKIDNKKVVDLVDETWLFVNGSAKNCRVE